MKLEAIALTDHDVVDGCSEFQNAAKKYPDLIAVNGCELGVEHPANVEIIALDISDLSPYLERQKRLLELRMQANIQRVELLKQSGFKISWDDVAKYFNTTTKEFRGQFSSADGLYIIEKENKTQLFFFEFKNIDYSNNKDSQISIFHLKNYLKQMKGCEHDCKIHDKIKKII